MAAELPSDIRDILEAGERVLWSGKPLRAPFLLKSLSMLVMAVPVIALPLPFIVSIRGALLQAPVVAFFALWYSFAILIGVGPFIYNALVWKNLYYVLTDRRIIVRKGVVGIDYDALSLDLVQEVNVDVGFWDQRYGTGTLTVRAVGVRPLNLFCVERPLEVYRLLKRAVDSAKGELS